MRFFKCRHCGQMVAMVKETYVDVICCGDPMLEVIPNGIDASREKHVPIIKVEGTKVIVTIGEVIHPSENEHYIEWIFLATNKGNQRKEIKPGDKPEAVFYIGEDEEIEKAYAYCNLHGLWFGKTKA